MRTQLYDVNTVAYESVLPGAFIASSRHWGDWNYGYSHAAGGLCLVLDNELWFYFGAFSGQESVLKPGETGGFEQDNTMYAGGATVLATLRRNGFASLDAGPEQEVLSTLCDGCVVNVHNGLEPVSAG